MQNKYQSTVRRIVEFVFAGHNSRRKCAKSSLAGVRAFSILEYIVYNMKRAFSIFNDRCKIKTIKQKKSEASAFLFNSETVKSISERILS